MNTYAAIALFYGLVGLTLFVGCFVYPAFRSYAAMRALSGSDPDAASLGAVLIACMLGTLLMMATISFGLAFEQMSWVLAGLCGAYATTVRRGAEIAEPSSARRARAVQFGAR